MRVALPLIVPVLLLGGCQKSTAGDNVREAYDNKADAIDRQADAQPNATAKDIYKARADAFREEGKDREQGLEGREPSKGPTDVGAQTGGQSTATPQ